MHLTMQDLRYGGTKDGGPTVELRAYAEVFGFFFLLFRASLTAYGGSQARGRMEATAASLRPNHSSARSEPHL